MFAILFCRPIQEGVTNIYVEVFDEVFQFSVINIDLPSFNNSLQRLIFLKVVNIIILVQVSCPVCQDLNPYEYQCTIYFTASFYQMSF